MSTNLKFTTSKYKVNLKATGFQMIKNIETPNFMKFYKPLIVNKDFDITYLL